MNLASEIISAFPKIQSQPINEEFIELNENIMELAGEIDLFHYLPAYMLWCLKHQDKKLIDLHTVNALAEYGRTKMKENNHLNFKWRCTQTQKSVVIKFLEWCLVEIPSLDEKQLERAIRNWKK